MNRRYRILILLGYKTIIPSDMTIRMFKQLTERVTKMLTYGVKESELMLSFPDILARIKPEKES